METENCKNCGNPIPDERRVGSIYCCYKCGWTYRNRTNREMNKEKQITNRQLDKNYKIVKKLYVKGNRDVSIKTLELMGVDFEFFTGVKKIDQGNNSTIIKLFEFNILIKDDKCIINKNEP